MARTCRLNLPSLQDVPVSVWKGVQASDSFFCIQQEKVVPHLESFGGRCAPNIAFRNGNLKWRFTLDTDILDSGSSSSAPSAGGSCEVDSGSVTGAVEVELAAAASASCDSGSDPSRAALSGSNMFVTAFVPAPAPPVFRALLSVICKAVVCGCFDKVLDTKTVVLGSFVRATDKTSILFRRTDTGKASE